MTITDVTEHGRHGQGCQGCRDLQVVDALTQLRCLCLDGYAFENIGRRVIAVDDVMAILNSLPGRLIGACRHDKHNTVATDV